MNKHANKPVPIVLGSTGVGKTELVHSVAKDLEAEMISADSRAIYKNMDIGTATPPEEYRDEVPYHVINFLHPRERFSAMDYRRLAEKKIKEIRSRDRLPVIVGGSRLYILALTQGIFEGPDRDEDLREKLRNKPSNELHDKLQDVDPPSAEKIHPNDTKRVVRALEVYELTGRPISELKEEADPLNVDFKRIGLNRSREELYRRINKRVDRMLEEGLLDEVKTLVKDGFGPEWGAWETIGYKELAEYLEGGMNFSQAVEGIKANTRHLAKYQQNWLKKLEGVIWLKVESGNRTGLAQKLKEIISDRL